VEFPVWLIKFSLEPAEQSDGSNELFEASRFERCSTAHPMHRTTETILERIGSLWSYQAFRGTSFNKQTDCNPIVRHTKLVPPVTTVTFPARPRPAESMAAEEIMAKKEKKKRGWVVS
jgi:hypothetical protein